MRSPVDIIKGRIVDIDERRNVLKIEAPYTDWPMLTKRGYRRCLIQLVDGRPLSNKQRKTCYALMREISGYTGQSLETTKIEMKSMFLDDEMYELYDNEFSLSDAPMSLVCAFQRFLVRFILDWDIPCSFPLLDFVDDVSDYIYACLLHKKCCICGQPADLHHVDHVGTGRDREEIIHEGMETLPLCRIHHSEDHAKGEQTFKRMYHIPKGVVLDKTLCKLYGLKVKREEFVEC